MAKGTVAVVAIAVVLCAVYGVFADEADCPSVDDMYCVWKQPVGEECRKESYIELDDGTRCPACEECLDDDKISVSQVLGLDCPIAACPRIEAPASCNETFYTLKMDVNGNECTRCQTFVCE